MDPAYVAPVPLNPTDRAWIARPASDTWVRHNDPITAHTGDEDMRRGLTSHTCNSSEQFLLSDTRRVPWPQERAETRSAWVHGSRYVIANPARIGSPDHPVVQ